MNNQTIKMKIALALIMIMICVCGITSDEGSIVETLKAISTSLKNIEAILNKPTQIKCEKGRFFFNDYITECKIIVENSK